MRRFDPRIHLFCQLAMDHLITAMSADQVLTNEKQCFFRLFVFLSG